MALAERISLRDDTPDTGGDVVLGDDFVAPNATVAEELRARRERRGMFSLKASPLTRKIIIFNLIALNVLVAGILYLSASRDSLVSQRAGSLVSEAELIADVFEVGFAAARTPDRADTPEDRDFGAQPEDLSEGSIGRGDATGLLSELDLRKGIDVYVFGTDGQLVGHKTGAAEPLVASLGDPEDDRTIIIDFLTMLWDGMTSVFSSGKREVPEVGVEDQARSLVEGSLSGQTQVSIGRGDAGSFLAVASPIMREGVAVGTVALASSAGQIDAIVRSERERVLQMFVIATLVSIGLSLVLASTIANPLADLAAAAEVGRDKKGKSVAPARVRIPDLTARPDEIGRLSGALRGMVAALYERIDANEQFAADVAHEIKNPLASLRSAVVTLRVAKREDQRTQLLDVIDHDVRRLDRLVSDISNASRLDSELVKEEQDPFDLIKMLENLSEYLGEQASDKGIDFISDLPSDSIILAGLEARLAQVFVNLITNAISFCEDGDAIRVWARRRENRVLVVVEDTGPGIPDNALTKIFKRFYSHRPANDFGNNSGLGLAISKQIVEAHGGVIWAENIRPTDADITSDPLGARFVVGLPI
ncbi:sensor histidine kinase ChvG [Pseudooceanicola batsensis HTCC2597]|uniref:histidine kinase n=1 Tax=Pseudooceanicola batsensis (strain ATCC BAA-863 / DSM 15984 / KCTC 12145 / HTCC2597) TaxID=252305 RepID=A3TVF4_PSEBH|nr:sensor histidine kinase [Pseudooceanicola batsensis]EAQ04500.1 sensor histidine kinase ChvG [Pseudooceanicola batsensis HTCC2597]